MIRSCICLRDLLYRIREAASPIKKQYKDKHKDKDKDEDIDKLICEQTSSVASQAGSMINDIKELTRDSNRKLIEAAIILYVLL